MITVILLWPASAVLVSLVIGQLALRRNLQPSNVELARRGIMKVSGP